jgi:glutamate synthase (ferredoxin)
MTTLLPMCRPALEHGEPVDARLPIRNVHRAVGTILGFEVTSRHGAAGLPDDTIRLHFTGSAGQSFGAFLPRGITLTLEGDANDYLGKGLSGGKIIVFPPREATFVPEENILVGNVVLYGATGGEAYVRGVAGERFAVRNSGALAVVEGVGDHGCEYMTAGRVVVIGGTGRNFAAGMSGGIAYVLDEAGDFPRRCNQGMVDLEPLIDVEDVELVKDLLARHIRHTQSAVAARLLVAWADSQRRFVKVMPRDYKRVLAAMKKAQETGVPVDEAVMASAHG